METIIKLTPDELDKNLINKIKGFIGGKENVDVTISIREFNTEYAKTLDASIDEAESGTGLVSFTLEDFMTYAPSK